MRGAIVGIVQARAGSTRLPNKVLAPLAGRPLLALLAARLAPARIDEWWLATTAGPDDDVTARWGEALGWHVQRGAVEDVLSRFAEIARARRPAWIVRITADDPFTDAAIVDHLLAGAAVQPPSVALVEAAGGVLPLGYAPQVARGAAVLAADAGATEAHDRAHVLTWLAARGARHAVPLPPAWPARPTWRWTVDTPADLTMAQGAFAAFGAQAVTIDYPAMVRALDARPALVAGNAHVRQKALAEG
ncbi:MAG: NTP transferase domain-containing protein [Deltaproteobacteria bacterium]|nr:NTP transferase domain-containing protein [Deltaproteobacteria bacterium]